MTGATAQVLAAARPVRRFAAWKVWGAAAALALLGHGAGWLFVPVIPRLVEEVVPAFPLVSFEPFHSGLPELEVLASDVRVIWSPSLFALASPLGFSQPVLEGEMGLRPPLVLPSKTHFFLERADVRSSAGPEPFALPRLELTDLPFGLPRATPMAASAGPGRKPIYVEGFGGLKQARFEGVDPRRTLWATGEGAWEARIYAEFNEQGVPRQVLLDEATPYKSINERILREVGSSRLANPEQGRSGWILLRYAGSAPRVARLPDGGARP